MKKTFLLTALCILIINIAFSQGDHKIQYRADIGLYDEHVLPGAQRLIGHVAFAQDSIRGYCDSAYLYEKQNYIIAFGDRVKIVAGNNVRLYGHRAYYNGNSKIASIANRVVLENNTAILYTDSLIYDLSQDCGYYVTGGKIINEGDTLTSTSGRYYTETDEAYVNENVLLRSKTYKMDCDALKYNAKTKIAYFISKTHLISDENTIYTDSGWYDTQKNISILNGNVQLFSGSQTMFADSIYYDHNLRFGRGWNNVVVFDTVQNFIVKGNYVEHHENGGQSIATDSNLLVLIDNQKDSLYLHSDTLKIFFNESNDPQMIQAYNKTKFYRSDMQGACDSLVYNVNDSLLTMYFNPVVWSDEYQLTGDTIKFNILDSTNMQMDLCKSGFIIGSLFSDSSFNQIKGTNITGLIRDKKLYEVNIKNNAECVYYIQEEDSSLIGVNTSLTNEMRIFLKNNKIDQIRFYDAPDGKIVPDNQLAEKDRKLQDFRWLKTYRPESVTDLYHTPIDRVANHPHNNQ